MERLSSIKKVGRTLSGRSKKDKKDKQEKPNRFSLEVPWFLQEKDGAWLCSEGHRNFLIYEPSKVEPFEPLKCHSCKIAVSNPCYSTGILKPLDKDTYLEQLRKWKGHNPRLGMLGVACCKCGKTHRSMSLRGDQDAVSFDEILGKQECDCGNKSDTRWAKTFGNWVFFEVGNRNDFRKDSNKAIAYLVEQRERDLGTYVDPATIEDPEWIQDARKYGTWV